MTRRYFWQLPELVKYRVVFENRDTVLGADEMGRHRLFRKDTGAVRFQDDAAFGRNGLPNEPPEMETILFLPARDAPETGSHACFH